MDIFAQTRTAFELPDDLIYMDGNSLGPLVKASRARLIDEVDNQWSQKLIRGWNESGWFTLPQTVGNKIAKLIGAPKDSVTAADSTSINLYKTLSAALALNPTRKIILSDSGNFPTDLYVAQGLIRALAQGHELIIVAPEAISSALTNDVAVLMLTHVDYRIGRLHDMDALTAQAHELGIITLWDLCHSAGALPVDVRKSNTDFAIGCGYKYLNGGPGAPAFLYVRPDHIAKISPALTGWMGHEAPFEFDLDYREIEGIGRMRVGTPPILALASLDAALDVWDQVTLAQVREKSIELSELFIAEVEARCPMLKLASPRDPQQRGSQVSFHFAEGYAAMQACIARGVIGDFRMPDIMRFGITPLYLTRDDIVRAAEIIGDILTNNLWDTPAFKQRSAVT